MIKPKCYKLTIFCCAFALLSFVLGILYYSLLSLDTSTQALDKNIVPDAYDKEYKERSQVFLISYADGPKVFFKNQNSLVQSAINKGFDGIINYKKSHIDNIFYNKNMDILSDPHGAGLWLWKPYFILKTMEMLPEDAII